MKIITRSIWILSLVSLFTDISSEMLYPIMPLYLKHIGFSVLLIGILEGFAEAAAGLSKSYFGKWSDNIGSRVPFVRLGYLLSALSKPMMAAFTFPAWIFSARALDRLGKGVRTGARDALLSDESTPQNKGKVFGFHRSMDTLGAVIGPVGALVFLNYYPGQYQTMFVLAFLPGMLSVGATFLLKEKGNVRHEVKTPTPFFAFIQYWKESTPAYKRLVTGLLFFSFINSSDIFLLLLMKANGLKDVQLIEVYIFYNLCYAVFAYPIGHLADRIGLYNTLMIGLAVFAVVYGGVSFIHAVPLYLLFFALYGFYAAGTEGVSKALISNISLKKDTAAAIGTYAALTSLVTLLSSSVAGFIWFQWGPKAAFLFSSVGAIILLIYFVTVRKTLYSIDHS